MRAKERIELRMADRRQRLGAILEKADDITDAERAELDQLAAGLKDDQTELRAAILAEPDPVVASDKAAPDAEPDVERRALREQVHLGDFVVAAISGREVRGASAEYLAAEDVPQGPHIPLSLFEPSASERAELEKRAATAAPGGTAQAVNLAPIYPAIFARAILPRIGVSMPLVESGHSAVALINASLSADPVAAGGSQSATAATWTVDSTAPHRVTGVLEVRIEDVAAVGTASFESVLRQNLQLALSAQLDQLGLTGDGSNANPEGLLPQLSDVTNPTSVADFDAFVDAAVGGIDGGPWAESLSDVMLLVNAETMRLAEKAFNVTGDATKGIASKTVSAAAYLRRESRGLIASSRMPDKSAHIATGVRIRSSTMGLDGVNAVELARCPVWGYLSVDDVYTKATSGTRVFSVHALIGDVMLTQPSAFDKVEFKVS